MGSSLEGLDPAFAEKVTRLLAAAKGRITIVSAFRSVERQAALWKAALAKYGSAKEARKWVAPPGKSNHGHGVAVDFGGDLKLLARLAPQFGLYQPMSWEPWHFEPLGSRKGRREGWTTPPDAHPEAGMTPAMREVESRKSIGFQMASLTSLLGVSTQPEPPPEAPMPAPDMERAVV